MDIKIMLLQEIQQQFKEAIALFDSENSVVSTRIYTSDKTFLSSISIRLLAVSGERFRLLFGKNITKPAKSGSQAFTILMSSADVIPQILTFINSPTKQLYHIELTVAIKKTKDSLRGCPLSISGSNPITY